jgi:hypothetical protein
MGGVWAGGRVYSAQALPAPPGDYTFHGGPHPVPPYGNHIPCTAPPGIPLDGQGNSTIACTGGPREGAGGGTGGCTGVRGYIAVLLSFPSRTLYPPLIPLSTPHAPELHHYYILRENTYVYGGVRMGGVGAGEPGIGG